MSELARARQVTQLLLDELGLDAYLFEVEPRAGDWKVRIDCAVEQGWEAVVLTVSKDQLLASHRDPAVRGALLDVWDRRLSACVRKGG